MNKTLILSIIAGIGIFSIGIIGVFGLTALSWHNTAASVKVSYEMKVEDNASQFDNMWKKITQVSKIPEQKKEAFKEIFTSYAESRSSESDNQLMTWVQESVPNADLSTYDNVMNIIVGSRDTWTSKQTELVAVAETYNKFLVTQPRGFVLSMFGHTKIEPKVITSDKTEKVFATGKDNDI